MTPSEAQELLQRLIGIVETRGRPHLTIDSAAGYCLDDLTDEQFGLAIRWFLLIAAFGYSSEEASHFELGKNVDRSGRKIEPKKGAMEKTAYAAKRTGQARLH